MDDAWMDFGMDDGWMDGVMDFDFVAFLFNLICFKAQGRIGGTRRTWPKIALPRGSRLYFRLQQLTLCMFWCCHDAGTWEAFAFLSANDNPLRLLGVSRRWHVGGVRMFVRISSASDKPRMGGVRISSANDNALAVRGVS